VPQFDFSALDGVSPRSKVRAKHAAACARKVAAFAEYGVSLKNEVSPAHQNRIHKAPRVTLAMTSGLSKTVMDCADIIEAMGSRSAEAGTAPPLQEAGRLEARNG
jgi:hypothetical protein